MRELMREYERARYPAHRRLDLHGEGPLVARQRALQWIQSHAHESPGEDLLLIVSRGGRPGRPPSPVEAEIRKLLEELQGKLLEWWQPFAPGSLAVRIASSPSMFHGTRRVPVPPDDGRTRETAGAAHPPPIQDIPPELYELARRVAELRIEREGLSTRVLDVVLREVWIAAQASAMEDRIDFATALERALDEERKMRLED